MLRLKSKKFVEESIEKKKEKNPSIDENSLLVYVCV